MLNRRLRNRGKGVYRLPLSLSGGAAGGGAAGGALCKSPAEQQAERTTWLDFWLLLWFHCQHSCNVDRTFKDGWKENGKTGTTEANRSVAGDQDTDVSEKD